MSGDRLRAAVVGVGHLGRHHARLLRAMPDVEFVGAADLAIDRARAAVGDSGARACADFRDLIDRVDLVVVAVPTADHVAVASPFLERGVHALVEKPMAPSVAEADALCGRAAASGAVLAVGHTERFNPAFQAAWPELTGTRFIEIHRLSGFPERSLDIDVVFDVMIHDLDIILAIDSSGVTEVEAVGVPVLTDRIDIANARVRFASGCIANVTASRISRDKVRKVRCFQRDRYVSVDYGAQELEVWRLRHRAAGRPAIEGGAVPVTTAEPLACELRDFVDAVRLGRSPGVDGAAGRAALMLATRVADAIAAG